ncbi:MAG: radical SAM/SPASM domain-containing protein [Anaerolineae bacterium]|jgi:radical SAM protein with 4Fe4S-binding SPASM domain
MQLPLPDELYIEVTNRCNSRCQTCVRTFETLEPVRDLSPHEFRCLVEQMPGLRRAVLHGVGEPLLNRDLAAMIAHLKGLLEPPTVLFNSNATLLTPAWQDALLDAGLDEFRVSTDAAHPELYARIRGVDGFKRMVDNVAAFAERIRQERRGPRLSFWFTAMHENLAELPDLVRLSAHLGVREVYVQRLVYYGEGLAVSEQSLYRAMHAAEERCLAEAEALAQGLGVSFRASGATTPRRSLLSPDGDGRPWSQCRRPSSLIYITANGNVLPCCFSPFTTGDYPGLVLGNAFETPLLDIWNGMAYRQFRANLQTDTPPESCNRCGACWSL